MQGGFKSQDVVCLVGITYRQLDYWDRSGVVSPSLSPAKGKGSERLYSFRDLVCLKVARQLKEAGVSLQKIRKSLGYLRQNLPEVTAPLSELVFITDGKGLFVLTDDPRVMVDTLRRGQLAWNVNVGRLSAEIRSLMRESEKPFEFHRAVRSGTAHKEGHSWAVKKSGTNAGCLVRR